MSIYDGPALSAQSLRADLLFLRVERNKAEIATTKPTMKITTNNLERSVRLGDRSTCHNIDLLKRCPQHTYRRVMPGAVGKNVVGINRASV